MSQHSFACPNTGHALLAGYDRLLGEYFFTVFDNQAEESVIAASISEIGLDTQDLNKVQTRVLQLVPTAPAKMFESIQDDCINNVGNRVVSWMPDGSVQYDTAVKATPLPHVISATRVDLGHTATYPMK